MSDVTITIDGAIACITIDRPPVNALTIESYREITDNFERLGAEENIACIILSGAGERAFCAGFDFKQFAKSGGVEDDPERPAILRDTFETVRLCPVPTIAAVNGPAIGAGCVLAAACDIRIGAENAAFGLPEIDFGRVGGAAYLSPMISSGTLREMAFTGSALNAREARDAGILRTVVPLADLVDAARHLAEKIASKHPLAVRHVKAALNGMVGTSIKDAYALEQEYSKLLRSALEGERS